MSGPASPSRLSLTLQGYDQVIAISQANINTILKFNFALNPKLSDFNVHFPERGIGLKGILTDPTVSLIDEEGEDKALFRINFESGVYYWHEFPKDDGKPKFDEDGFPLMTKPERRTLSVANWSLAFKVTFHAQQPKSVPNDIWKEIDNPGVYSVSQLMIDFGTADILEFSWENSRIPGLSQEKQGTARDDITRFVSFYRDTVLVQKDGTHNILCYAVKVNDPGVKKRQEILAAANERAPNFPPTWLRLQTINYRPNGDATKASVDHPHNAFLFTEMTRFNPPPPKYLQWSGDGPPPSKDLQWSGDWFYESIGGTLAMSHDVFFKGFLLNKLNLINIASIDIGNELGNYFYRGLGILSSDLKWMLDGERPTTEQLNFSSVENSINNVHKSTWSKSEKGEVQKAGFSRKQEFYERTFTADVTTTVMPKVGESKIAIESTIATKWKMVGSKVLDITMTIKWAVTLELCGPAKGGGLTVKVTTSSTPEVDCGVSGRDASQSSVLNDIPQLKKYWSTVLSLIRWKQLAEDIETALSGQDKFIFPGGGTFDMKTVTFSKKGDLLLGLTYRNKKLLDDEEEEEEDEGQD